MSGRSEVVWDAAHPVPRLRAWWEATQALEYHYRRAITTIYRDTRRHP